MYCVNCGQAVEGSIPICAHCAGLVIAKEEEKARFLEFIRQEAQITTTKEEDTLVESTVETEETEPQSKEIAPEESPANEETVAEKASEEAQTNNETAAKNGPAEENKTESSSDDFVGCLVFVFVCLMILIIAIIAINA